MGSTEDTWLCTAFAEMNSPDAVSLQVFPLRDQQDSGYNEVWAEARRQALTPAQYRSPDNCPSGMARDMGGGMPVYVLRPGLPARLEDLVETLDDAPPGQIATVDEQRVFAEAWRNEKKPR